MSSTKFVCKVEVNAALRGAGFRLKSALQVGCDSAAQKTNEEKKTPFPPVQKILLCLQPLSFRSAGRRPGRASRPRYPQKKPANGRLLIAEHSSWVSLIGSMTLIPDQINTEDNDPSSVAVLRRVEDNDSDSSSVILNSSLPSFASVVQLPFFL